MEKPKLGFHTFRKLPTKKQPHPSDQACLVVALNVDGTVNLLAYEAMGDAYLYANASMVQTIGETHCHYEPVVTRGVQPKFEDDGDGDGGLTLPPTLVLRTIVSFEPDDSSDDNLTCWQNITLSVPSGGTVDDAVQGGQMLVAVDGPHYTSPGGPAPSPTMPTPRTLMIPITGGTIPWWYLAPAPSPGTTIYKSTPGTSQQYYYP